MSAKNEYAVYSHCYQGSSKINIASHFNNYKEVIGSSAFHKYFECDKQLMLKEIGDDVDEEKLQLLEEYCNVDNLTVDGELKRMSKVSYEWSKEPCDPIFLHNSSLKTLNDTRKRNLLKNHQIFLKYRSEKPINYDTKLNNSDMKITLKPERDILVFVRIYVPFTSRQKQLTGALGKLSLSSVIAIPGFQTLDKLRDLISCTCDHSISSEISELPIRSKTKNAKDVYKSGFFFIENTFYNDFRDPNNKDISEVIRRWLGIRNFGTFKTEVMENTRVDSLITKFGYPWVYQHQGDCEHLISFSDARLVNKSDELSITCYPRIVRIKPQPNRYCMTCGIYSVNWVITNNNRLPHDPCLFCDSCFKSYNYIKGKKVGSFKAYPYPYDSDLFQPQATDVVKVKRSRLKTTIKKSKSEANDQPVDPLKKETTPMDIS